MAQEETSLETVDESGAAVAPASHRITDELVRVWFAAVDGLYPVCYRMGIRTMRVARRVWRVVRRVFDPVFAALQKAWEFVTRPFRRMKQSRQQAAKEWRRGKIWVRRGWRQNKLKGVCRAVAMPFVGVYKARHAIARGLTVLFPLLAAVAVALVLRYWYSSTFALRLTYMGHYVGDIADEDVFDRAADLAEGRVAGVDSTFAVDRTPELELTFSPKDDLLTENELCDLILGSYGDEVEELCGVYVDGKFEGAVDSEKKLTVLLNSILANCADTYSNLALSDVDLKFAQDVQTVNGLYPTSAKLSLTEMRTLLTDRAASQKWVTVKAGDTAASVAEQNGITRKQLLSLNTDVTPESLTAGEQLLVQEAGAYLDVEMTCTEIENRSIAYKSETVKDPSRYIGDNYVKIKGVPGVRRLTYAVTYIDGKEVSRKKLSEAVTRQPVTQVNAVGALDAGGGSGVAGDGIARGMIWPLPSSYSVGETYGPQYGRFHNGIDIYGDYGAPIIAADGGVVVEANSSGYNGGWGLSVLVDHGNGYQTRYAHCSAVLVTPGERVSRGQVVGRVGSTGYSTCNHLHFEVYRDGGRIDPYPLVAG